MNGDCVFCKILAGELPATEVNRTPGYVAIEDINPIADVHVLIIPERHFADFREIGTLDADESKRMLAFIADTAATIGLEEYRVLNYCGAGVGQTVFHLHWHLLGGTMHRMPA